MQIRCNGLSHIVVRETMLHPPFTFRLNYPEILSSCRRLQQKQAVCYGLPLRSLSKYFGLIAMHGSRRCIGYERRFCGTAATVHSANYSTSHAVAFESICALCVSHYKRRPFQFAFSAWNIAIVYPKHVDKWYRLLRLFHKPAIFAKIKKTTAHS
jgi:hypothetical protein